MSLSIVKNQSEFNPNEVLVYLASPFFNDEQRETLNIVTEILESLEGVRVFSPSRDGIMCPPDADRKTRQDAFRINIESINDCDIVVAIIEHHDTGTTFEIGGAYFSRIPVVAVDFKQLKKLNLMLAESFACYCRNPEILIGYMNTFVDIQLKVKRQLSKSDETQKLMEFKTREITEYGRNAQIKMNEMHTAIQEMKSIQDKENNIVCQFEKGKFNETQKFTFLETTDISASKLATIMREFGDWLNENFKDLS